MPTFIRDDEFDKQVLEGAIRRLPVEKKTESSKPAVETLQLTKLADAIERAIITQASAMQVLAQQRATPQNIQITQKEAPHRRSTFTLTVTERDEDGQIVQVKIVEDQ
jgi:hypothetical protein